MQVFTAAVLSKIVKTGDGLLQRMLYTAECWFAV